LAACRAWADRLPETSGIGPIGGHEAVHRIACVKRKVTARTSCSHIDAGVGKVSLEGPAVVWRSDHDRHAAVLDGGEEILTYPLGEFLLVTEKRTIWSRRPTSRTPGPVATASPV
jgi:hypothetical protein